MSILPYLPVAGIIPNRTGPELNQGSGKSLNMKTLDLGQFCGPANRYEQYTKET